MSKLLNFLKNILKTDTVKLDVITKYPQRFLEYKFQKHPISNVMKTSDDGLKMIEKSEGTVLKIYLDQAGLETIGIGHLLTPEDKASDRFKNGITKDEALELLRDDVKIAEDAVNSLVKVSLTQNQFDALVDFTFNLGVGALSKSSLLKKLNAGDHAAVPAEFMKWNKVRNPKTGQLEPLAGLTKRRQKEADLWNR